MNRDDIIRMVEAEWRDRLSAAVAAEQKAVLDTVDELTGMERDRNALFSEGYDHALFHIKQFVEGRARVK